MVNILQLNNCCCCCTLEAGSRIISCIQMVIGLAIAITVGVESRKLSPEQKSAYSTGMIITGVITALLGMTLFFGVNKRRLFLVYTWVVTSTICMIVNAAFLLIALCMNGGSLVIVLSQLIPILLSMYFILVVYSYYREEKSTITIP